MPKSKEFRDPVHGYIAVPADYCHSIVDTPIFQRLREIEQTGMRVLYPGARHCRFSHSLGTYHLGQKAFRHFRENARNRFNGIENKVWDGYEKTFSIACLLHDCAHAPFSHTFENYYDYTPTPETSRLQAPLLEAAHDERFKKDYTHRAANQPSAHEKASAVIVLKHFSVSIRTLGGDPLLASRMILGCRHVEPENDSMRLENCLIALLHGKAVDVDKLDYIMRDTWASGVDNASIDTHRLLSSLTCDDEHRLAFRKSALSVLQGVVDARNHLYQWIFGHHKVVYNQYLLTTAIKKLANLLSPGAADSVFSKLFSLETFENDTEISKGVSVYLPTDQDLTVLLRQHRHEIPEANEYLFRQHSRKALWKTAIEFRQLFPNKTAAELEIIKSEAQDKLATLVASQGAANAFVVQKIPRKLITIRTGEIMVQIGDAFHSYDDLFGKPNEPQHAKAFYVYAPIDGLDRRDEFIEALQKIPV